MLKYCTILYPVKVPDSIYCWELIGRDTAICDHFDNQGGMARCTLFNVDIYRSKRGYKKYKECEELWIEAGRP